MHNFGFYIHFYGPTPPHRLPVLKIKVLHLPLPTLQQPLPAALLSMSCYIVRLFMVFAINMLPIILLGWPKSSFGFFHKMVQKIPNKLFVQTNTWYFVLHYPGFVSSLQCWQRCPFLFLLSCVCVWGGGFFRFSDSQRITLLTQLYHPILVTSPHPIPFPSLVNLVQWLSLVPRACTWVPSLTPKVLSKAFYTFAFSNMFLVLLCSKRHCYCQRSSFVLLL